MDVIHCLHKSHKERDNNYIGGTCKVLIALKWILNQLLSSELVTSRGVRSVESAVGAGRGG